ncbi:heme ABC transporter ATP-binding protein [Glaesserella parasuis]|uniref:heme ABC transporter ATP-binding protein n=1 Tax=Glaesserella parasuis TaxID=738 RepID=UPI00095034C0|nr:heme ABC transporter ATP-binding protein [Glaesserella parasuis]MDG6345250.1 heme ABC transporter ATP-binding protein [Glaesserella parasuis]MDG6409521.1 heme ABC transporter ATP-binding protein [Glaesserella parasuis]MDG6449603.1 heme ABC transporter ATP-binding protein [Glaesserella parasuis]MDG6472937.1 heme ABC transporter ATP-binding protein [Glaesserella parasuis]MDG6770859.1 heme ABC transporter ATP-binding protein [Glaesserella parasuis]
MLQSDRLLIADRLTLTLNQRLLLDNISLVLPQGKMTVLIGPNGVGKSTLLRLLSGYLSAKSGEVRLHNKGIDQFSLAELAQHRAVMRQHSLLNFPFSVEEVIRMGGYHRSQTEVDQHLEEVIMVTECTALRNKAYRQLSGGEQQRTQLARALLQLWSEDMRGKLLFLDEPTSTFDLYHQQHCLRLLKQLCQKKGLTVCCILHDLNLASLYGDQLILLAEQHIQACGSAAEVIQKEIIQKWYKAEVAVFPHFATQAPQIQLSL